MCGLDSVIGWNGEPDSYSTRWQVSLSQHQVTVQMSLYTTIHIMLICIVVCKKKKKLPSGTNNEQCVLTLTS